MHVIETELAHARMGRVYKARDTILEQTVAINIVASRHRDAARKVFSDFRGVGERQLRAWAAGGRKALPIKDLFDVDGIVGVVVAYVEGKGAALDISEV
jgi:hypothetical protein